MSVNIPSLSNILTFVIPGPVGVKIIPTVANNPPVIVGTILYPHPAVTLIVTSQVAHSIEIKMDIFDGHTDCAADMFTRCFLYSQIDTKACVFIIIATEYSLTIDTPSAIISK